MAALDTVDGGGPWHESGISWFRMACRSKRMELDPGPDICVYDQTVRMRKLQRRNGAIDKYYIWRGTTYDSLKKVRHSIMEAHKQPAAIAVKEEPQQQEQQQEEASICDCANEEEVEVDPCEDDPAPAGYVWRQYRLGHRHRSYCMAPGCRGSRRNSWKLCPARSIRPK